MADCYFYVCNIFGYNSQNIGTTSYKRISSLTFSQPITENEISFNIVSDINSPQNTRYLNRKE